MIKRCEKVFISYDSGEDTLIVTEEHKGKLTRDSNGAAEFEAAPEPVEMGRFEHLVEA